MTAACLPGFRAVAACCNVRRLLATFLAINALVVLVPVVTAVGWDHLVPHDLGWHLDFAREGSTADRYAGVLFAMVAVLAAAHAWRVPTPRSGPRWLWIIGWVSAAGFAALTAFEELHRQVDAGSFIAPLLGLKDLESRFRWILIAAPLALPFALAALWVLLSAYCLHPARAFLTLLAVMFAGIGLVLDAMSGDLLLYRELVERFGFPPGPAGLYEAFEEGFEQMAAATLVVVLVDMQAARPPVSFEPNQRQVAVLCVVFAAVLVAAAIPMSRHQLLKGDGWDLVAPWSYGGPLALVTQEFRATSDDLTRVEIWAYVQGPPHGRPAEVFARIARANSPHLPIRESRGTVHGQRFSNATTMFEFEPIPNSGGEHYVLSVGVLSGPAPTVHVGLTNGATHPESPAVLNGSPTRFEDDLAIRTHWVGRYIDGHFPRDPRIWFLIGEVLLYIYLWTIPVVAVWFGITGPRPDFWRRYVGTLMLVAVLVAMTAILIVLSAEALLSLS